MRIFIKRKLKDKEWEEISSYEFRHIIVNPIIRKKFDNLLKNGMCFYYKGMKFATSTYVREYDFKD